MKIWIRLVLLLLPSLISLGLLAFAISTYSWTIPLFNNLPRENSLITTNDTRLYSTLIPIVISQGLFTECIAYRRVTVLVSNAFDFREEQSPKLLNETCLANQFSCITGVAIRRPLTRCIEQRQNCNQIIDCEDNSDEINCENQQCPIGYVNCSDGKVCYRKDEQTCDGVSNCLNNSDEENCNENKCATNKHVYCPREKRCARRENSYRCDGIVDCADNSDEENCQQCNGDKNTFLCDSKCFLPKYRCDGIVHCSDFGDELNCENYASSKSSQEQVFHKDRLCEEKRFNPWRFSPPTIDPLILQSYTHPQQRIEYLNLIYYLQLIVFYGFFGGLILTLFAILSLVFYPCCRRKYSNVSFYSFGIWILLAWLFISIGLISFLNIWIWKKEILVDDERTLAFDSMIYQINSSLKHLQFFGFSYWLACGSAVATFIALLFSCCICCTMGSLRSENKEYEIMHMQNY